MRLFGPDFYRTQADFPYEYPFLPFAQGNARNSEQLVHFRLSTMPTLTSA
jgi:hypothetical protein